MTQEFHISVTPVRDNEYWVRTEHVAPGVPLADEQFVWPVQDWLEQARHLMNDPLVGLLQGSPPSRMGDSSAGDRALSGSSNEPSAKSLVDLGRLLYEALFQGRLRDSWMTAQGIAQHRGEVLRLRLGLKGSYLPRLPWEVLNGGHRLYAGSSRPLATGTDILFSRYQPGMGMLGAIAHPTAPKPRQTLRLLMAIAAPNDQQRLQLKQEAEHLQQELKLQTELLQNSAMIGTLPDIQVTILEQPGREQLAQALEQGNYQIFHFAGHSELSSAGGQLYLVNRQTGLSELMSGDDLAGLLVNNGIQMAVFNSCRGAYTANMSPENSTDDRSLTEALVSQGVPAVLAMAEQIPDDVALTLARLFYRNLKQDYPVDLSLSRARQGLVSAYSSQQLYWALPILYMHPEFDGYLTSGDRALENPADSLIRSPQSSIVSPISASHLGQQAPLIQSLNTSDQTEANVSRAEHFTEQGIENSDIAAVNREALANADAVMSPDIQDGEADCQSTEELSAGELAAPAEELGQAENWTQATDEVAEEASSSGDLNHFSYSTEDQHGVENLSEQQQEPEPTRSFEDVEAVTDEVSAAELDLGSSVHSFNDTSSGNGEVATDDFFLPEDDLKVFDEGLATEEEAATEAELDEEVSTWSLVEELKGSDIRAVDNGSNASANPALQDDAFTHEMSGNGSEENVEGLNGSDSFASVGNSSNSQNLTEMLQDSESQLSSDSAAEGGWTNDHVSVEADEDMSADEDTGSAESGNHQLQVVSSSALVPAGTDDEEEVHHQRPRRNLKKVLLLPLAGVAGAVIVVLGHNLFPTLDAVNSPTEVSQSNVELEDLPQASTSDVVRFANVSFSQSDLPAGQAAVEELLKRGSVDEAKSALETVPDDQISDPLVTFLQGRLVWENLNQGETDAAIQDVSSYWTFAASQADNPLYYNALGFAHYRQNRFHDAINAWQEALETLEVQGEAVMPNPKTGTEVSYSEDLPNGTVSNPEALTAYAGIALALAQLSVSSESQPHDALSRAIQIQQVVLQSDPAGFSPEALAQSWLWTEATIQEWQLLTQIRPQ